jgi:hypothetical protein
MARVTMNWVNDMAQIANSLGYGDPRPHDLLAYAVAAAARAAGYVVPAGDYQEILDEHADTLDKAIQRWLDIEFDAIVRSQPSGPTR